MKKIVEIKNLSKNYGKIKAVKKLSLDLYEGEIFGFIGPNGAGKSSTIRCIMNLLNKTEGKVLIEGKEFQKNNIEIQKNIGYLPSEVNLYEEYTVGEMLNFHESFYENVHENRKRLVKKLNLDESKKIEDLSFGNLKKLGIILALMHEPKILILDEATSGLDPIMQNVFFELLKEEKEKGTTIFYSTHILSEVSKICDRVGIIKEGKLIKIEDVKEIKNKNLTNITIESNDVLKIKEQLNLDCEVIDNKIIFKNEDNFNNLLKKLIKYDIKKILIEEPTLEDIFYHYYK
jgi:ABC-2 type transport system ATP-binding protein